MLMGEFNQIESAHMSPSYSPSWVYRTIDWYHFGYKEEQVPL